MFCTTLRRRPSLSTLIPLLASSTNPKLHETALQTHDLALPTQPQPQTSHTAPHRQQQQQRPSTQLFLILTPSSLHDSNSTERMRRFSTLAANPTPTIAFILSTSSHNASEGMHSYMQLQTQTHPLPTPTPTLPIPTPQHLLPILLTYTSTPQPPHILPPAPLFSLPLLPHLTSTAPSRPLSVHTTNILSDLCRSVKEVARLAGTERGGEVLGEWLGEGEGREVVEFWEGEWIV